MEIIRDILKMALDGKTKTKIVYDTKINFRVFNRYAALLLRKQLLTEKKENKQRLYKTTEKGKKVLTQIEEVLKSIEN